jgi:transcriptional regulator with XRE-family HTH domain
MTLAHAYRSAIRRATLSIAQLARQMGSHRNTVSMYLYERPPSAAAVRRLVDWLRDQAQALSTYADALEAELDRRRANELNAVGRPRRLSTRVPKPPARSAKNRGKR